MERLLGCFAPLTYATQDYMDNTERPAALGQYCTPVVVVPKPGARTARRQRELRLF
jgi:hypothetical protein